MEKAPVECGQCQRQRPRPQNPVQERDRESAELHLLRDSRKESPEEDGHPGEARIELIRERNIGGCPGTELIGKKIEPCLISEKKERESKAYHVGHQERSRAEALPAQGASQGEQSGQVFAVDGFRGGNQNKDKDAHAEGAEHTSNHVAS